MKWTSTETEFIQEHLEETTRNVFTKFGKRFGSKYRSYDSVQKKVFHLRPLRKEIEFLELSQVPTTGEKRIEKEEISRWLQELSSLSKTIPRAFPSSNKQGGESLILLLSDLHFGKVTPFFDITEAKYRLQDIIHQILSKPRPYINEIIIVLAGDLVEGEDIFSNQNSSLEVPAIHQVKEVTAALWKMICQFESTFSVPVRIETAPGNHGRVSKTASGLTNWDNVVYEMLSLLIGMSDNKNLGINCNFKPFGTFEVKGKKGLIYHHGVKHLGTPAMQTKIAGWLLSKEFDFMVHGHWHHWKIDTFMDRIIVSNGSLCGPDDLSEQIAKETMAKQAYFFIGEEIHGFNSAYWESEPPVSL